MSGIFTLNPSRVLTVLALMVIVSLNTACATRALMSSDRYEKPVPETQEFDASTSSRELNASDLDSVKQAYLSHHLETSLARN